MMAPTVTRPVSGGGEDRAAGACMDGPAAGAFLAAGPGHASGGRSGRRHSHCHGGRSAYTPQRLGVHWRGARALAQSRRPDSSTSQGPPRWVPTRRAPVFVPWTEDASGERKAGSLVRTAGGTGSARRVAPRIPAPLRSRRRRPMQITSCVTSLPTGESSQAGSRFQRGGARGRRGRTRRAQGAMTRGQLHAPEQQQRPERPTKGRATAAGPGSPSHPRASRGTGGRGGTTTRGAATIRQLRSARAAEAGARGGLARRNWETGRPAKGARNGAKERGVCKNHCTDRATEQGAE